jgi:anaerobic selenocysteine-containing dehydrogenase
VADFARYQKLASRFPPDVAASLTGISATVIADTARALAQGPSIILAGADPGGGPFDRLTEAVVAGLNPLLGNVGSSGGILERRKLPLTSPAELPATVLTEVPDKSIRLLIIDSADDGMAFPAELVRRKLTGDDATVVSLSPYLSSRSALADYLVPAPAAYESIEEVVTPSGAVQESCSLSLPLMQPPHGAMHPSQFLRKLAHATGMTGFPSATAESLLRLRVDALYAGRAGSIVSAVDGTHRNVSELASADELWQAMKGGGCWLDDQAGTRQPRRVAVLEGFPDAALEHVGTAGPHGRGSLVLMPAGWRAAIDSGALSPLMSKVFQESDLRGLAGKVFINPSTAESVGVTSGGRARLRTQAGCATVTVVESETVMPGVISGVVGPLPNGVTTSDELHNDGILSLCDLQADGTWRVTPATMDTASDDGRL